jgi:hypothetical protein
MLSIYFNTREFSPVKKTGFLIKGLWAPFYSTISRWGLRKKKYMRKLQQALILLQEMRHQRTKYSALGFCAFLLGARGSGGEKLSSIL